MILSFASCAHLAAIENRHLSNLSAAIWDDFAIEANALIASLEVGKTREAEFKDKLDPLREKYQLRIDEMNAQLEYKSYKMTMTNLIIFDSILKDNKTVNIYKLRTSRVADGRFTDDEATPVVFKSGRLVNIGWSGFTE